MITFGGGSVKKNGVYDQVKEALKNHYTVEFWGIEPNPAIETLRKAIALGKEENSFANRAIIPRPIISLTGF